MPVEMPQLLTPNETAQVVRRKATTLAIWRTGKKRRCDLPFIKVNGRIMYRAEAVRAWLERNAS
jgi:hypothetical protein